MSELDELKKESSVLEAERQSEGAQAEEDDQEIADLEAKLQSLLDECEVVETKTRTIQVRSVINGYYSKWANEK